jgi:hypothetical protein
MTGNKNDEGMTAMEHTRREAVRVTERTNLKDPLAVPQAQRSHQTNKQTNAQAESVAGPLLQDMEDGYFYQSFVQMVQKLFSTCLFFPLQ